MTHRRTGPSAFVALLTLVFGAASATALDEALYAELLTRYTREVPGDLAGVRVDYRGLREAPEWPRLIESLAKSDPSALRSRDEKLAFWIDAYNVLAIDLILRHYPVESIRDIGWLLNPVWKQTAGVVGGTGYSLDEIEHGIIRPLGDARAHAAVICASLSCPPLSREPWRADRLDAQLDAAMRRWLAHPEKGLAIDRERKRVTLSRIFRWFDEDFAPAGGALAFVTPYLDEADRGWLRAHGAKVDLAYFDYDWSLNELQGS